MKVKIYLFLFGIIFLPMTIFGQLTSFNAGPKDGRYNICEGETIILYTFNPYFNAGPNPVEVDWLNSPIPLEERYKQQPTFFAGKAGTYEFNVTMKDLIYNVTLKRDFKIVVVGKPLARAGSDVNLCKGQSYKCNAVESLNSLFVSWTHNGRGQLLAANTLAPTYIPATDELGSVMLILKINGSIACGGESKDSLNINYFAAPTSDISVQSPLKICSNKEYKLNGIVTGNISFNWIVVPKEKKENLTNINTLSPTYTPQINEAGTVLVILESKGAGCSIYDTLQMNVSQMQVLSSKSGSSPGSPGAICRPR